MENEKFLSISRDFLELLLDGVHNKPTFVLWDGSKILGNKRETEILINYPWSLREMFLNPSELSMAEAYIYGDIDIKGNIYDVFPLANELIEKKFGVKNKVKLFTLLKKLPSRKISYEKCFANLSGKKHSKDRDASAISYHYDVSNDFFRLFLDKNMQYSCAYFESEDDSIDVAQEKKMEYICRKLSLTPGEKLLDIGAGWGGLIIYAAKNYGVIARGITLSKRQYEYARNWIKKEGLEEKCSMELLDYRDIDGKEKFDKIVSVGMFEHVGRENYEKYLKIAYNILKEGGLFLNHGISIRADLFGKSRSSFSEKYVFPDGELLPIYFTTKISEMVGFEIRDVECLREHYSLTLRKWVSRLEKNREKAIEFAGEKRYRIWRLYMAGSAEQFKNREIGVYQTLLLKDKNGMGNLPLSRRSWYL